jgi:hypothetical protein
MKLTHDFADLHGCKEIKDIAPTKDLKNYMFYIDAGSEEGDHSCLTVYDMEKGCFEYFIPTFNIVTPMQKSPYMEKLERVARNQYRKWEKQGRSAEYIAIHTSDPFCGFMFPGCSRSMLKYLNKLKWKDKNKKSHKKLLKGRR